MGVHIFRSDGTSKNFIVGSGGAGVHIGLGGSLGGGTLAVNKVIAGLVSPLYDEGVAITYSAVDDDSLLLAAGDVVQLVLSGSTSPSLQCTVTGAE